MSCMNKRENKRQQQSKYAGRKKKFSKELEVGQKVEVQDEKSEKWRYSGIIKRKRESSLPSKPNKIRNKFYDVN